MGFFFYRRDSSGLLLLTYLAMVAFSVTAKLIIGLVEPASTELIAANSFSRCISPHAHMEEIKPAKLIQTPNIFFCICTVLCAHIDLSMLRSLYKDSCHIHFAQSKVRVKFPPKFSVSSQFITPFLSLFSWLDNWGGQLSRVSKKEANKA